MGPLVPDIIGNELNFIVAFLIGIGFGFILEQAGFSSSKKLVGLFYGYDFTVLRVFFTAGVTALLGVLIMDHYHILNTNLIYINPLFLYSAIVGGLIMGMGFVVGGFCPGTSICAAAIGKIDALYFILGSAIGIFIFIEGYPLFEGLYLSANLGNPQIFDTLGMSQGLFAFLMVVVALSAFYFVTKIEKRVNNGRRIELTPSKILVPVAGLALFLGASSMFFSSQLEAAQFERISIDELAIRIMERDKTLQLIDVRPVEEFKEFALPNSVNADYTKFLNKEWQKIFNTKGKVNIIYGADETESVKAALAAKDIGYDRLMILEGGLNNFEEKIMNFEMPDEIENKSMKDTYRFRAEASKELPKIIEEAKPKVIETKSERVLGGC
jgi:rhodanese-related sulfurtransferase/uncharacterized membrane protein YedE/YeeE